MTPRGCQNERVPLPPRPSRPPGSRRRAATAALALLTALAVGGCGATAMNSAGRSDSAVVTEDDLVLATEGAQQVGFEVTAGDALAHLLREPVLTPIATEEGYGISDAELRGQLEAAGVADPSDQVVALVRSQFIWDQLLQVDPATLSPQDAELIARMQDTYRERIGEEDVSVDPRFGVWDDASGTLSQEQPAWIVPSTVDETAVPVVPGPGDEG